MNAEIKVDQAPWKERDRKTRVYFFHDGESVLEGFGNRAVRPSTPYRTFLPAVAAKLGLPADAKFAWSRKAGCGCGCSPGFIAADHCGSEVFVTLTADAPRTDGSPKGEAEVARRLTALAADPTMPWNAAPVETEVNLIEQ